MCNFIWMPRLLRAGVYVRCQKGHMGFRRLRNCHLSWHAQVTVESDSPCDSCKSFRCVMHDCPPPLTLCLKFYLPLDLAVLDAVYATVTLQESTKCWFFTHVLARNRNNNVTADRITNIFTEICVFWLRGVVLVDEFVYTWLMYL